MARTPGKGITPSGTQIANMASGIHPGVVIGDTTRTLTEDDSGKVFIAAVDATFTLPAVADVPAGFHATFECGAVSAGTGLSVSPAAADGICAVGAATGVVNKDIINSGASDVLGDRISVVSTGVTGTTAWQAFRKVGTWAKEA